MNNEQNQKETNHTPKRSKAQRIAAMICIILLVGLYVITLITAFIDKSATRQWFMLCLIGTVVIPLLTWIYIWMYGMMTNKHTIASFSTKKEQNTTEAVTEDDAPSADEP